MTKEPSSIEKFNNWSKNSVGVRIFTIVFLILILLIPVSMVENLIRERERYQENAMYEISDKWGAHQTITGLVVSVPYYTYSTTKEKGITKTHKHKHYAHFLPSELNIKGKITPEKRYRGIYEVVVYKGDLSIEGAFDDIDPDKLGLDSQNINWAGATLNLGISDLRSIQNDVFVDWNGQQLNFNPGLPSDDIVKSGISTNINIGKTFKKQQFKVNLKLNGSEGISFTPLGKTTKVSINSNWADPSFNGAFLPDNRKISKDGFTADWEVLHLNRNYPQEFTDNNKNIFQSNFGLDLKLPVDEYQKSMRSVKYAVMFISLTFLFYFFSQIKQKVRIHPIQYLIIGLAICLFFTLLIALSEHMNFQYAYLIGSMAIISIITTYSFFIFKDKLITSLLAGILIMLYGFIYVIIQMQDFSLLIGSLGLFVILSSVMYLSRNIDWYNIGENNQAE
ncbi:MAG: cell envelope integrity protein CreD [Parvicellaceae bacterium]